MRSKKMKHWSEAIREASIKECKKTRKIYLELDDFKNIVQLSPEISFTEGTTTEEIYEELEDLGVITIIYSSCLRKKIVIPTEKCL